MEEDDEYFLVVVEENSLGISNWDLKSEPKVFQNESEIVRREINENDCTPTQKESEELEEGLDLDWIWIELDKVKEESERTATNEVEPEKNSQRTEATLDKVDEFVQLMLEQDQKPLLPLHHKYCTVTFSGRTKCKFCNFECVNRNSMLSHFRNRHNDNAYKCLACDRQFKRKDTLITHEHNCRGVNADIVRMARRKYKGPTKMSMKERRAVRKPCPMCGKMISTNNMATHIDTHSGVRRFMCNKCPATFRLNKSLKAHLNEHNAQRPYACDLCTKSYTSNNSLQAHKLDHRGRLYQCDICGMAYKKKHRVLEHILKHSAKPAVHLCTECGVMYNTKGSLSQHLRSHRLPIPCSECPQTFKNMVLLKKHAKIEHGSLIISREKFLHVLPQLVEDIIGSTSASEVTMNAVANKQ